MTRARVLAALFAAATLTTTLPLIAPSEAYAQGSKDTARKVEELSAKAAELYGKKDFLGAIELFKKAYELEPVPNLLYNIARCYEKAEKYEEAIEYYKKFTVAPDVDSKSREDSLKRIETLQDALDAKKALNTKKDPNGQTGPNGQTTTPKPVEQGPDRTVAYVLLGGGALALAGGATMGVLAKGKQSDFEAAGTTPDERRALRDSGERFALMADGMYVVGAGLAVVGIYMAVTAKPAGAETSSGDGADKTKTLVAPWFSTTGGGVTMQLGF